MERIREVLMLGLLGLLPFHALLVTVGTRMIAGPGHAPFIALAVWKEVTLAIILFVAVMEIARAISDQRSAFRRRIDFIDVCIITLVILAGALSARSSQLTAHSFILGFKYDFVPLIAFLILRRVPWSDAFVRRTLMVLLLAGVVVAGYGILTFFLPMSFFTVLGYSAGHSLYLPDQPLAAFQQIGGTAIRRIQSTMSGPNQLGLWLLLPWSIAWVSVLRKQDSRPRTQDLGLLSYVLCLFIAVALLLTFSRAAWVGAAVILVGAMVILLPRSSFLRALVALCTGGCVGLLLMAVLVPGVLLRTQSTRGHFERPLQALRIIAEHPFGLGLGSAGPASNRIKEPCVFLGAGADASWARSNPLLCVFVGDEQVRPAGHACDCPLLPENWYLQIGVELGIIGMALFIVLTLLIIRRLSSHSLFVIRPSGLTAHSSPSAPRLGLEEQLTAFLVFLALSIAALFLHAWEDSAVAYTAWMLTAVVLERRTVH